MSCPIAGIVLSANNDATAIDLNMFFFCIISCQKGGFSEKLLMSNRINIRVNAPKKSYSLAKITLFSEDCFPLYTFY